MHDGGLEFCAECRRRRKEDSGASKRPDSRRKKSL